MPAPDTGLPYLGEIDRRIAAVLEHPGTSYWLREALETALDRDAVDAVNDADALHQLLGERATALFDELLGRGKPGTVLMRGDNDQ